MRIAGSRRSALCCFTAASVLTAAIGCEVAPATENQTKPSGPPPHLSGQTVATPRCTYRETGFRQGVIAPRQLRSEAPDLAGLVAIPSDQVAIVELRIDATGQVTESCVLRGVRSDVDQRVLQAVQKWVFEPARLRASFDSSAGRFEAGTAVPIFMTVAVPVRAQPPDRVLTYAGFRSTTCVTTSVRGCVGPRSGGTET